MAGRVKLSEQYVRFTVDGLKEAEGQVTNTTSKINRTWAGMATQTARQIRNIFTGLGAISTPFASLWAMSKTGAQGTKEAADLAASYQYAAQVISSVFAPAMRIATTVIVRIADVLNALSPATKSWLVAITLTTLGIIALVGAVTLLSTAFAALGAVAGVAWAIISSPIILIAAGIIAIVAAISLASGYLIEFFQTGSVGAKSWISTMITGIRSWVVFSIMSFNMVMTAFTKMWNGTMDAISWANKKMGFNEWAAKVQGARIDLNKVFINPAAADKALQGVDNYLDGMLPKFGELGGWSKNIINNLRGVPGLVGQLLRGEGLAGGGMKLNAKVTVGFESLQESFDRLQQAFASGNQADKLEQIRGNGSRTNEILTDIFNRLGLPSRPAIVGD
jgi:hypothetical protein